MSLRALSSGDNARGDNARGDKARGDKARGDKARGISEGFEEIGPTLLVNTHAAWRLG